MSESWIDAFEGGRTSGVYFLDMSAAFDIVDHSILLKKLELYGFDQVSLDWFQSYLTDRSQCVCINGSVSTLLPVLSGVPQGSILGPILYTLVTNELPEVVHNDTCSSPRIDSWPPFTLNCDSCGNICCFANDTTYSTSGSNQENLSNQISNSFRTISDFLSSNGLKLNEDKTHLLTIPRKTGRNQINSLVLDTSYSKIQSSISEKHLFIEILSGLITLFMEKIV